MAMRRLPLSVMARSAQQAVQQRFELARRRPPHVETLPKRGATPSQARFQPSVELRRERFLSIPDVVVALLHARISVRADSVLPRCDRRACAVRLRACRARRRTAKSAASRTPMDRIAIMSVMDGHHEARRMPIRQPLDPEGLRARRLRESVSIADVTFRLADEHAGAR